MSEKEDTEPEEEIEANSHIFKVSDTDPRVEIKTKQDGENASSSGDSERSNDE